jgi:hypothetical protein
VAVSVDKSHKLLGLVMLQNRKNYLDMCPFTLLLFSLFLKVFAMISKAANELDIFQAAIDNDQNATISPR